MSEEEALCLETYRARVLFVNLEEDHQKFLVNSLFSNERVRLVGSRTVEEALYRMCSDEFDLLVLGIDGDLCQRRDFLLSDVFGHYVSIRKNCQTIIVGPHEDRAKQLFTCQLLNAGRYVCKNKILQLPKAILDQLDACNTDVFNVLVVDDEADEECVKYLKEMEGFAGTGVKTAAWAREAFRTNSYDIVLMDVVLDLDNESGFDLIQEFQSINPDQVFVVMSEMLVPEFNFILSSLNVLGVMYKPLSKELFETTMNKTIGRIVRLSAQ